MKIWAILRTISAILCGAAITAPVAARELTCESQVGGYQYCRGDTASGIRLSHQLDRFSCLMGDTWGYDGAGVWVANGCRAVFVLGPGATAETAPADASPGLGDLVLGVLGLQSQKPATREAAPAPFYGAPVNGPAPASFPAAPQNRSASNAAAVYAPQATVMRCESKTGALQRCPAIFRSHVELARKFSGAPCQFNLTWGYEYGSIWVDRGCRAEFALY